VPTDPLTSSRYPAGSDSPNIAQYIQNAVVDLADNTVTGPFATTTARDAAFTAWTAMGNSMRDGLECYVTGVGKQVYRNGAWRSTVALQAGAVTANITSSTFSQGNVTFPEPFPGAPNVMLTVLSTTPSRELIANVVTFPTTTGFGWRVRESTGTTGTYSAVLMWFAGMI